MTELDALTLPAEPRAISVPALSWTSAITPIALSVTLFLVTKAPTSLLLAGLTPGVMLITYHAKRRAEQRRYARESAQFAAEVHDFEMDVHAAHQRERESWLRLHPNASVIGSGPQLSQIQVEGQANSPRVRKLKRAASINNNLPVIHSAELDGESKPMLLTFRGNIAQQLSRRFETQQVDATESVLGARGNDRLLTISRDRGQICVNDIVPVRLELRPLGVDSWRRRASENELAQGDDEAHSDRSRRKSLIFELGQDRHGEPRAFDLVRDGPHALIAGTTGSGKSQLLQTMLSELARQYTPQMLHMLLVDFKGGASLQHLEDLPHVVALLSDLETADVTRIVAGLTAEIRRRERVLRKEKCSDISELHNDVSPPRLVIVVDEFATLVSELPELHAVFVDVAARGRALGMHLVIATQRPTGTVRDSLVANCALKFCLRVTTAPESVAVIGSDAASRFGPEEVGMCVDFRNGIVGEKWQVRQTLAAEMQQLLTLFEAEVRAAAYWLPPLETQIAIDQWPELSPGEVYLGLADNPERLTQSRVTLKCMDGAALVVFGSQGSGKTALCELVAKQWTKRALHDVRFAEGRPDRVWDMLENARDLLGAVRTPGTSRLWIFDDLDVAYSRMSAEHAQAASNTLSQMLQDRGPDDCVLISLSRIPTPLAPVLSGHPNRIYLAAAHREQHVGWGLPLRTFVPNAPPGRAHYHGLETQIGYTSYRQPRYGGLVENLPADRAVAIVTTRREFWRQSLTAGGVAVHMLGQEQSEKSELTTIVGEPEDWLANPALTRECRTNSEFIFDRVSVAELRQITRRSTLPPPVIDPNEALIWASGGEFRRVRLVRHPEP